MEDVDAHVRANLAPRLLLLVALLVPLRPPLLWLLVLTAPLVPGQKCRRNDQPRGLKRSKALAAENQRARPRTSLPPPCTARWTRRCGRTLER